jgi:hypothetical protein
MKKFNFLILIIISVSTLSFGQKVPGSNQKFTAEHYKKKAGIQRSLSYFLFSTGVIAGTIFLPETQTLEDLGTVAGITGYAVIGGTVLYLASIRNKKKARKLSAAPGVQKIENTFSSEKFKNFIPVVTFKIRL